MAFIWQGNRILFNDRSPDWKFLDTISYRLDIGTGTEYTDGTSNVAGIEYTDGTSNVAGIEYIVEKWEHLPSKTEHNRHLTTKHYNNKAVVQRRQIKPFGKMEKNKDPSKYTTIGEEVFMEWNPAVFFYSNKLSKHCQRMLADPTLIREPIIFNKDNSKVQPAMVDEHIDLAVVQQVNDLYRPDINSHINFMRSSDKHEPINPLRATWGIPKTDDELNNAPNRNKKLAGTSGAFIPRHQRSGPEEATVKITELGDTCDSGTGDIAAFLRKYGINNFGKITIPKDRESGINRDMTFINFETVEDAKQAVDVLTNQRARFGFSCVKASLAHQS
jgi:hypothetical protein